MIFIGHHIAVLTTFPIIYGMASLHRPFFDIGLIVFHALSHDGTRDCADCRRRRAAIAATYLIA